MVEAQFEKGQQIVYGTNGICTVESVDLMRFSAGMPKEMYYVLRQHRNKENTFFVPIKNEKLSSRMREIMQKEDIEDILMGLADVEVEWIEDRRARGEYYKEILQDGVSQKLLSMIIVLYKQKRKRARNGKKLPVTESGILKSAEKLVGEEFGWVLGIELEQVPKFIRKRLHIPEEE